MSGFELDTDEVGSMAKTLHATPGNPYTAATAPSSSFPDLAAAGAEFARAWGTGVTAMVDDVTRLADSVEQAVIGYLASDQHAAGAFGR